MLYTKASSESPNQDFLCESLQSSGYQVHATICGLCASTAHQMLAAVEEPLVLDTLGSRWGSGLLPLLHSSGTTVDLVLLMVGTNDLAQPTPSDEIFAAVRGLHAVCHSAGVRTVALGIPDAGGRGVARLGRGLVARKQAVNESLAHWARNGVGLSGPELFINTVGLMPFGPKSRQAGVWASFGV